MKHNCFIENSACCAGRGQVRITDAAQIDGTLRPLLQGSGYDLSRGSGVALGMDYSADNTYGALDDAGVAVSSILADLHTSYDYHGDHESDQTDDKQHLAGFGWGRTEADVGIEDWGFHHPMQAVLCSDQDAGGHPAMGGGFCAAASTAGGWTDERVGFDTTTPPGRCGPAVEVGDGSSRIRTLYRVWDDNDDPLDDLPPMEQGIATMRERCAEMGLELVRITSAAQIDDELRPMLQKAGYDLSRGSGVPLAMDYNLRNSYEALDDASVSVGQVFAEVHSQRGYQGDHNSDQTGDKQALVSQAALGGCPLCISVCSLTVLCGMYPRRALGGRGVLMTLASKIGAFSIQPRLSSARTMRQPWRWMTMAMTQGQS